MTFRRHRVVLLVALFGLLSPSLAAGAGAIASGMATPAAVAAVDDTPQVPFFHPCKQQGGKRVLPCNPDPGVLTRPGAVLSWVPAERPAHLADPMLRLPVPAADPPPPRRA